MAFPSISLLKHAKFIYTIEAYRLFKKEFVKGVVYDPDELHNDTSNRVFGVSGVSYLGESWGQRLDEYTFSILLFGHRERLH